ncbi:MAG: hypothetical protein V1793_22315 [Pseudomonadota bacterium]
MEHQPIGNGVENSEFAYIFKFKKTDANFNDLWAMKSSARESLRDWLIAWVCDPKTAENCANACSELIENCIKFSIVDTVSTVLIRINEASIVVETRNMADEHNLRMVQNMIQKLATIDDLREYFAQTLLTPNRGKSQLGILKIIMETKGAISFVNSSDDRAVHIRLEIDSFSKL